MEYQQEQFDEGLKPTKYELGDMETDEHVHIFYFRDDLPIATTTSWRHGHHAHSIEKGPGQTFICVPEKGHTHTKLTVKDSGDYTLRGLHNP